MPRKDYKYKAFISYSHQDKKWGDWLHRALETYRVPKGLVGKETEAPLEGSSDIEQNALFQEQFLSGWILFASVLILTAYNARKKITMLPIGSAASWLQVHIYLGLLSVLLFLLHIIPGGRDPWSWPFISDNIRDFFTTFATANPRRCL